MLSEVIFAVEAFAALRTDLGMNKVLGLRTRVRRKWSYLRFEPAVNDCVEIQMLFSFETFQAHMTHIRTLGVVTWKKEEDDEFFETLH